LFNEGIMKYEVPLTKLILHPSSLILTFCALCGVIISVKCRGGLSNKLTYFDEERHSSITSLPLRFKASFWHADDPYPMKLV